MIDRIQKAWEEYHGPVADEGFDDYIPAMPPAFRRGFVDGYELARKEVVEKDAVITDLKKQLTAALEALTRSND